MDLEKAFDRWQLRRIVDAIGPGCQPGHMRRWPFLAGIAFSAAALFVGAYASPSQANTNGIAYGGYSGNSTPIYGVDGYIRPSSTVTLTTTEFRGDYLNICPNGCSNWVQLGTYQGYLAHISSPSATHVYLENNWPQCGLTTQSDYGTLAAANQAYYIYYDGLVLPSGTICSQTAYEYIYKKGSYSSSPITYGYGPQPYGIATVATELHGANEVVPENTDYFGTNDSHVAVSSYGIHVQTSSGGSFGLWSAGQVGGPYAGNPPFTTLMASYWAFRTTPS